LQQQPHSFLFAENPEAVVSKVGTELALRACFSSAGASMSSFGVQDTTEDSFVYDMKLLLGSMTLG
jgi:hypothetical protein